MKKNTILNFLFLTFVSLLLLTSCASREKIVYFQNKSPILSSAINHSYNQVYHSDDLLTITVSALDIDAVKPFNLPIVTYNNVAGTVTGQPKQQTYLIDSEGNIDFPVLGVIKIAGLDRMQATNLLKEKLKPYVNNPIVNIRIINFKITVLGEVQKPGSYNIPYERITLPEAIGMAGDLLISGRRTNILVIRDENGKKTEARIDLTKDDLFNSPYYYLKQNDVVYVEPNKAKINSSSISNSTSVTISAISTIISLLAILTR